MKYDSTYIDLFQTRLHTGMGTGKEKKTELKATLAGGQESRSEGDIDDENDEECIETVS